MKKLFFVFTFVMGLSTLVFGQQGQTQLNAGVGFDDIWSDWLLGL